MIDLFDYLNAEERTEYDNAFANRVADPERFERITNLAMEKASAQFIENAHCFFNEFNKMSPAGTEGGKGN